MQVYFDVFLNHPGFVCASIWILMGILMLPYEFYICKCKIQLGFTLITDIIYWIIEHPYEKDVPLMYTADSHSKIEKSTHVLATSIY